MKRISQAFLIASSVWILYACSFKFPWTFSEFKRLKSPKGQVEAVVLTGEAGAVAPMTTFVVVVPAGSPVSLKEPTDKQIVFRADHLRGFDLVWRQPQLLEIGYQEAIISHFENLIEVIGRGSDWYPVEIHLASTTNEFAVPPQYRQLPPKSGEAIRM